MSQWVQPYHRQIHSIRTQIDHNKKEPEFGAISQKEITETLEHIFGAKTKKVNGVRMLTFDITKLQRLGKIYDLEIEIKVLREGEESGSDRSDWTDVGIGKYTKSSTNEQEKTSDNQSVDSQHVSKATHPALTYSCYYCETAGTKFETKDETEYQKHGDQRHPNKPMYPNEATIEKYNLRPQGREWER